MRWVRYGLLWATMTPDTAGPPAKPDAPVLRVTREAYGLDARHACEADSSASACALTACADLQHDIRFLDDDGCTYDSATVEAVLWLGSDHEPCKLAIVGVRSTYASPAAFRDRFDVHVAPRGRLHGDGSPVGSLTMHARENDDLLDLIRDITCDADSRVRPAIRRTVCDAEPE
jgi:hypothetical protein